MFFGVPTIALSLPLLLIFILSKNHTMLQGVAAATMPPTSPFLNNLLLHASVLLQSIAFICEISINGDRDIQIYMVQSKQTREAQRYPPLHNTLQNLVLFPEYERSSSTIRHLKKIDQHMEACIIQENVIIPY
jgi:hypothetical protein